MDCQLCQCDEIYNFHHLIPRTLHSNKWFKSRTTREQRAEGINVCRQCHRTIHELIPSEKEIGRHYGSLDKLLAHEGIARYVAWKQRKRRVTSERI